MKTKKDRKFFNPPSISASEHFSLSSPKSIYKKFITVVRKVDSIQSFVCFLKQQFRRWCAEMAMGGKHSKTAAEMIAAVKKEHALAFVTWLRTLPKNGYPMSPSGAHLTTEQLYDFYIENISPNKKGHSLLFYAMID